jgi:enoyl-CoA hydratase/carnithine racemase
MTSSAQPSVIQSEPASGLRLVTLIEPRLRNATTTELTAEWTVAFDEIAADPAVRAVVITGAGSAFCSGTALPGATCRRTTVLARS